MIHEDKFVLSHRPYAVDLGSWHITDRYPQSGSVHVSIRAVWFRRRNGITAACTGLLQDYQGERGLTHAVTFLERMTDGRYGGWCEGRWDGERYWGAQEPAVIESHLALLRPMLENYPEIPPRYDGWWRF